MMAVLVNPLDLIFFGVFFFLLLYVTMLCVVIVPYCVMSIVSLVFKIEDIERKIMIYFIAAVPYIIWVSFRLAYVVDQLSSSEWLSSIALIKSIPF